jgi:hypothetical protein
MVLKSVPSGFADITRPSLRSKKNRRPAVALEPGSVSFGLVTEDDIEFSFSSKNEGFDLHFDLKAKA